MMCQLAARWAGFAIGCFLLCVGLPARADKEMFLLKSFSGNYNFTGTAETLRSKDNKKPCNVVSSNTDVYAALKGVPAGAKIEYAQLYWAGSGTTFDYTVNFDGVSVTAPAERRYSSVYTINGTKFTYFSGAVDVTTQVAKKGNATYRFNGLTVSTGSPWCDVEGVLGGFALVVVYSHPGEVFRMLNMYEGFQAFRNTSLSLTLSGFNVPDPLPSGTTGRIGHVTWEGDVTLSQNGEDLLFNGYEMTDSMNPSGNQFNSASNVTGDSTTYGIDFDTYTVKSPVIKAGQTSATTTYRSGQDLVMLSSEIAAIPYAAIADLSLTMARSGTLTVGSNTAYTLTVANGGVDAETGPVTVVDTLPSGLKFVSASGTGWTCSSAAGANGTTVVTCTQPGPVASGAKMTPLTVTVTPTAAGTYTNSATVKGTTGDPNQANNTASNDGSAAAAAASTGSWVFTSEACAAGKTIVPAGDDTAGCHRFGGPLTAGSTNTPVYLTYVSGSPQKTAVPAASPAPSVSLRASCLPNSGVSIGYAGTTLDCKGGTQNVALAMMGTSPATAALPNSSYLVYNDVGRVVLEVSANGTTDSVVFISKPSGIRLMDVLRASDNYPDQLGAWNLSPAYTKDDSYAFAKAGEQFILRLGARMANNEWAPSFGKEKAALQNLPDLGLPLDFLFTLDLFAVDPLSNPVLPVTDKDDRIAGVVRDAFVWDQPFTQSTAVTGAFDARVRWYEGGYLAVTPILEDYLGTGKIGGPPATNSAGNPLQPGDQERLVRGTRVVGRFYPDHFKTDLTANFPCAPDMKCPTAYPVEGATYAGQPFGYVITAYGLARNGADSPLSLFRHMSTRLIALDMFSQPNATTTPAGGQFAIDPNGKLPFSANATNFPDLKGRGSYKLGNLFDAAARPPAAMTAPTAVYLRAAMDEKIQVAGNPNKSFQVTSITTAPGQYEDGLVVAAGRLQVGNVFGSELLNLPVPLTAQYWNGANWVINTGDSDSTVAPNLSALKCTKSFALNTAGDCKTGVIAMVGAGAGVKVQEGKGKVVLKSPGRGVLGSIDFNAVTGTSLAPWLPSTIARATFGLSKSPVIYIREVY